ncbi:hypothetical protein [Burkholderia pyrrocinia]
MATGAVTQGIVAPAEVVKQLQAVPSVSIGGTSVRPVPPSAVRAALSERAGGSAQSGRDSTFVVRDGDNLVGVSTNDLIVVYADTAAVYHAVVGQVKSVDVYPQIDTVIVHVGSFDQLSPIKTTLARKFPMAKFSLPVRYSDTKPK